MTLYSYKSLPAPPAIPSRHGMPEQAGLDESQAGLDF